MRNMTIGTALSLEVMKDAKIIAGKNGLNREIRWVNVIEVLDAISLLQESELLITTAFGMADNPGLISDLIPVLAERKLAGLAIQTGYYLHGIPAELIRQCDEYDFPLIEINKDVIFTEITKAITKRIINNQTEMLEYTHRIVNRMTDIILNNQGLSQLAKVLFELVNLPVRIFDMNYNILSYHGLAEDSPFVIPKETQAEYQALSKDYRITSIKQPIKIKCKVSVPEQYLQPLLVGNDLHGFISVIMENDAHDVIDELEKIAVSSAATISILEIIKQKTILETEDRIKGDFLDDLLENNLVSEQNIKRRANYLGYDLTKSFVILTLSIDNFAELLSANTEKKIHEIKEHLLYSVRFCLNSYQHQALVKYKNNNIIILLQVVNEFDNEEVLKTAGLLKKTIKSELKITISIGIGRKYINFSEITRSYQEALQALSIGARIYRNDYTISYDELGPYTLFAGNFDEEELFKYYQRTISPLIECDNKYNTELVKTLETFLNYNNSYTETAKALYFHRHTIKYRLNRIYKLTGLNPENTQHRLQLQLGLMVARVLMKN